MRISWGGWLAAASLARVATAGENTRIIFTDGDFQSDLNDLNHAAILIPSPARQGADSSHKFTFVAADTAVKNVTLRTTTATIAQSSFDPDSDAPAPVVPQPTDDASNGMVHVDMGPTNPSSSFSIRASTILSTDITTDRRHGTITINDLNALVASYQGQKMYFQINWDMEGAASYSRYFTVAPDLSTGARYLAEDQAQGGALLSSEPAFPESTGTATTTASGAVATKSSVPIGPGGTSSGDGDGNGSTDNGGGSSDGSGSGTTKSGSGGGGSSGLSTGAIAGIAVGAGVVGILVTGGLIWLLIRRRRAQQALADGAGSGGPYGSQGHNRTQELMAEKEANAGVDVSPHSPYSDDGHAGAGGSTAAATAAGVAAGTSMSGGDGSVAAPQQHDRTFTPYSDHQRSSLVDEPPPVTTAAAASPGRSTPSAAQTPYVHLVEDGMTEDDIRRLEAEERELDQAIEQAGRR